MNKSQNKQVWNEVVKNLKLTRSDRIILGHIAFGIDDSVAAGLIGITEEKVSIRRLDLMARLGDLGISANENMLGLSLFMTMTEGLNANHYDSHGIEDVNRPDIKTRLNTLKMFNLVTGGMLGQSLLKFTRKMFDEKASQDILDPPVWINQINVRDESEPVEVKGNRGVPEAEMMEMSKE